LTEIIGQAGPNTKLVLSSSWRKSFYQNRVEALEKAMSKHSETPITFDARTKPGGDDLKPRVELIGDFVREYSKSRPRSDRHLRVLVLDDFAATPPEDFGFQSCGHLEEYLRKFSFQPKQTSVKVVHCYEEWTADMGEHVRVGSGLTHDKVCEAEHFLLPTPGSFFSRFSTVDSQASKKAAAPLSE